MPPIFHRKAYVTAFGPATDIASFEIREQLAKLPQKQPLENRNDSSLDDWLPQFSIAEQRPVSSMLKSLGE